MSGSPFCSIIGRTPSGPLAFKPSNSCTDFSTLPLEKIVLDVHLLVLTAGVSTAQADCCFGPAEILVSWRSGRPP